MFNNIFILFIDYEGKVGIRNTNNNTIIKWLSKQKIPGNKFKLSLDSSGYLNINSIELDKIYIRHKILLVNKSFKNPLSLIISNNGEMNIYENGFKKIASSNDFKVIEHSNNFTMLDTYLDFKEKDISLFNYLYNDNDNEINNINNNDYKYVYNDYFKSKLNQIFL